MLRSLPKTFNAYVSFMIINNVSIVSIRINKVQDFVVVFIYQAYLAFMWSNLWTYFTNNKGNSVDFFLTFINFKNKNLFWV